MPTNDPTNNEAAAIAAPTSHNPWLQTPTETPSTTAATDIVVFGMGRDYASLFLTITTDRLAVMVTFVESVGSAEDEQYRYSRSDFTADEFLAALAGKRGCNKMYGWPSTTQPDSDDNDFSARHILDFCRSHDEQIINFVWGATPGEEDVCLSLPAPYLRAAMGQGD